MRSLHTAADLFGVDAGALHKVLVSRRIAARGEVFFTPTNHEEAVALRDSLAKAVYLAIFMWAVEKINRGTECASYESVIGVCGVVGGIMHAAWHKHGHHHAGILDIYGFECFANNSLEQLCINYANEKLQQQFVSHVFRLEQAVWDHWPGTVIKHS